MLTRFICWLLGHRYWAKAFTGQSVRVKRALGYEEDVGVYVWEKQKFCLRCGKEPEK